MKDVNLKEELKGLKKLGNAKIGGLVCNKTAPMILRIEVDVPHDQIENVLEALDLEATEELKASLEAILKGIKK
jgi:hypothetical protein